LIRLLPSLSRFIQPILRPLWSDQPAAQLIRQTARQQWRLIALNLSSSLIEALSEGATLGVVFLAVQVLSAPAGQPFDWGVHALLAWWPALVTWLNGLPATTLFISLLGLAVLLQGVQSLTRYLNLVSMGYFAARCHALVTARIHSQVLSFSFPCASGYKVGDLTDYAGQGPSAIQIQIEQTSGLAVAFLLVLTYLGFLVGISPWLLLAVVLIGGLISLIQKQLLPQIRSGSRAVSQTQAEISRRITEDFQGLRLLHSSGQLDAADQRLASRMGELELQLRRQARRLSLVGPFASFLPILAIALIAAISLLLLGGRSSGVLPSLVTFVLALQRLNVRLTSLANITNRLADNNGRINRLNQILSSSDKQFRLRGGKPFTTLQRQIRFEQVSLRYSSELKPALADISFTLQKGQMLALVGPSGAGKSSIAVSQDTFLFNATIAENIAFGTPNATLGSIQSACQAAQAARFIEALPEGYNTLVGERGYRLSGGQRQRLSLARAILRDPELLILDEATSALDSQSERLVQEAIEHFERDHTVLVIAHRLSTIVCANQILVLDAGRVVQRGTHDSLLAAEGLYRFLWQQQAPYMLP
jgi:subfamily B ATP-binding cassette protein MsbA